LLSLSFLYRFTIAQVTKLIKSAKEDQEVARKDNETKFFWLETTAQPLRADNFVHVHLFNGIFVFIDHRIL